MFPHFGIQCSCHLQGDLRQEKDAAKYMEITVGVSVRMWSIVLSSWRAM